MVIIFFIISARPFSHIYTLTVFLFLHELPMSVDFSSTLVILLIYYPFTDNMYSKYLMSIYTCLHTPESSSD